MALAPQLTALDRRVLGALSVGRGKRVFPLVQAANPPQRIHERVTRSEVEEILRGLEHLGLAENRNGWWRRADG